MLLWVGGANVVAAAVAVVAAVAVIVADVAVDPLLLL